MLIYELNGARLLKPETKKEESDLNVFGIPNNTAVFVKQEFLHVESDSTELPNSILQACAKILKPFSKKPVLLEFTPVSNTNLNGIKNKQLINSRQVSLPPNLVSPKHVTLDLEQRKNNFDLKMKKEGNLKFNKNKFEEQLVNKQYMELAEQKRRGYSDLFENAEVQEYDEDDFM